MKGKLLTFLLAVCAVSNAIALECYVCTSLGGFCNDGETGELQTCPNSTGFVAKQCVKFDGEISGSVAGNSFSTQGVIRNCNVLPANVDDPPLRCFSGSDATAYYRTILDALLSDDDSGIDDVDVTMKGDLCFCASDGCNGTGSLKPFLCLILTLSLMHLLPN